ncbi:hypothetical protein [Microbacterium sp.]|uniref:hypothetical protein n=1 Tax=Microbacterium sp. TaxID=51671 RepID=UPI0028A13DB0|nr:hypothetical protein [Microbacterium sp.]
MDDFDFWLDPDGLDNQAGAVDSWREAIAEIASSGLVPIVIDGLPGASVYSSATNVAKTVHIGLLQWTAHMQNVLESVSAELRSVASEGREIDLNRAARFDLIDPTEYNGNDPTPGDAINKSATPRIAPEEDRPPDSDFMPAPKWQPVNGSAFYFDAGSGAFDEADAFTTKLFSNVILDPVGDLKEALGQMGVTRARDTIMEGFGGGWGALRRYSFVLRGMSQFLIDMHSSLTQVFGGVSVYWQGYSANSANEYLDDLLDVIDGAADGCARVSEEITTFCDAVVSAADIVGGVLEDLAIDAYIAALGIAAGKKISVVGWLLGGGAIAAGAKKWLDITGKISDMQTLVDAMTTARDLGTQLSDITESLHIPEMVETS